MAGRRREKRIIYHVENQAQEIIELWQDIDGFQEPLPTVSDYVSDAMFKAQERRLERLDGLCMNAMRQMILDEARRVVLGRTQ